MATNTTDRNNYLLNLNSLNNVITSASGTSATITALSNLQKIVNASNYGASINTLTSYSGSNITCTANINLSNSAIYFNSNIGVTSNSISGNGYLAIKTNTVERARFTSNGVGIGVTVPLTNLDIAGSELVRGNLYISSMGGAGTANIYADGSVYAAGFIGPSDERLKTNIQPYVGARLPTPVSFQWKATGIDDIGFIAQEVAAIEPRCVSQRDGILHIDYQRLLVLCVAEVQTLRAEVSTLRDMCKI